MLAAYRAGIKQVVLPKQNQKDMEKVPLEVKKDLRVHFVSHIEEVLKLLLLKGTQEKKSVRAVKTETTTTPESGD